MPLPDNSSTASADKFISRAKTGSEMGPGSNIAAGHPQGAKSRKPAAPASSRQNSTDAHLRIIADAVLDGLEGTRKAAIGMAAVGSSVVEVSHRLDGVKSAVESQLTALLHMRALADVQEQHIRAQQRLLRRISARAESLDRNVMTIEILVSATMSRFLDFISLPSMIKVILAVSLVLLAVGIAVVVAANLLWSTTRAAQKGYPESPVPLAALVLVTASYFSYGWYYIGQRVGYSQYWASRGKYRTS